MVKHDRTVHFLKYVILQILEQEKTHNAWPTGQCNGAPTTDWSSSLSSNQWNIGEGDLDLDSHCAITLSFVNDDGRKDFSSSGSNWVSSADCCEGIKIIQE